MSELIDNSQKRKELLKHMILQLHKGEAPEAVKAQLGRLLGEVPYDMVVEVEQELMSEGLSVDDVLKMCDIHSAALRGNISKSNAKDAPPGHPIYTFQQENRALHWEIASVKKLFDYIKSQTSKSIDESVINQVKLHFNSLADIEKHYRRKENLLFPFMEKHGITGPPKVMWGKHDETRELMKSAAISLDEISGVDKDQLITVIDLVFIPALNSIEEMIYKEEEILFPMCMDTLTAEEWYHVYSQSIEIGFCLYDPTDEWKPDVIFVTANSAEQFGRIQLPSGSLSVMELVSMLNTIPFDLTFVDDTDTVRFFTQGRERIFERNRAIIGRKVQMCHPPSSVGIVQKILDDFRSGAQSQVPFWINMGGRFIHIEYFALRDKDGTYLGTIEVSQDLTEKRRLEGEQRLLSYTKGK
jgi:uncharacterized protein